MTNGEFTDSVLRTWNKENLFQEQIINATLGIVGEAGEVAEAIKKWRFHGTDLNRAKIVEELGDVLYYVTAMLYLMGSSVSTAMDANSDKLRRRYPQGFEEGGGIR